jgi:hypothetical protein
MTAVWSEQHVHGLCLTLVSWTVAGGGAKRMDRARARRRGLAKERGEELEIFTTMARTLPFRRWLVGRLLLSFGGEIDEQGIVGLVRRRCSALRTRSVAVHVGVGVRKDWLDA